MARRHSRRPRHEMLSATGGTTSKLQTSATGLPVQLKLHEIVEVTLPTKTSRPNDENGSSHGLVGSNNNRPGQAGGQQHPHLHRKKRSDSIASSAAIFSASQKRASQFGAVTVQHRSVASPPRANNRPISAQNSRSSSRHNNAGNSRTPSSGGPGGHSHHAEPIAFDPFKDAAWYRWLLHDPASSVVSQQYRSEPSHLHQFRAWLTTQFPKVVRTLRALQMLHDRLPPPPRRPPVLAEQAVAIAQTKDPSSLQEQDDPNGEEAEESEDDADTDGTDDEKGATLHGSDLTQQKRRQLFVQRREAQQNAWRVLFENVRLVSIPPGDRFVVQDGTAARDVFMVLSGHCQLLFQPKFLDVLVQQRDDLKSNSAGTHETDLPAQTRRTQQYHEDDEQDARYNRVEAFRAMRRLSLGTLTSDAAAEAMATTEYAMRELTSGEYFGHEACAFGFTNHIVSAISHGALHRNPIGITTQACLHMLVLPFQALQKMRDIVHHSLEHQDLVPSPASAVSPPPVESLLSPRRRAHVTRAAGTGTPVAAAPVAKKPRARAPELLALPGCRFKEQDVEFLRHTFIFQSIQLKRLEFLATQVRLVHVPKHEYLFTTGQQVAVYLVKSGQLRVCSPERVKILHASDQQHDDGHDMEALATVETRHVELEILQLHDSVGLMEASLLQSTFANYCLATSHDVYVYVVPPVALFTVLAHEPSASHHVVENLLRHHSWYKARKFTALNHHNKQTEFRLSLGAQRKSPLPCSRCGWSGHTSTSSLCVRATSVKTVFIQHLAGTNMSGDGEPALPPVSTALSPSHRSRSQRMTQRLALGSRMGSVIATEPTDGLSVAPLPEIAPRRGSTLFAGGGGRAGESALPVLVDLAALLGSTHCSDRKNGLQSPSLLPPKRMLEMALDRLDTALDLRDPTPCEELEPRRPQTQLSRHASYPQPRASVFNLQDEALRAVARISTAATVKALPSQRTKMQFTPTMP